jgi:hypothetical protein
MGKRKILTIYDNNTTVLFKKDLNEEEKNRLTLVGALLGDILLSKSVIDFRMDREIVESDTVPKYSIKYGKRTYTIIVDDLNG